MSRQVRAQWRRWCAVGVTLCGGVGFTLALSGLDDSVSVTLLDRSQVGLGAVALVLSVAAVALVLSLGAGMDEGGRASIT